MDELEKNYIQYEAIAQISQMKNKTMSKTIKEVSQLNTDSLELIGELNSLVKKCDNGYIPFSEAYPGDEVHFILYDDTNKDVKRFPVIQNCILFSRCHQYKCTYNQYWKKRHLTFDVVIHGNDKWVEVSDQVGNVYGEKIHIIVNYTGWVATCEKSEVK